MTVFLMRLLSVNIPEGLWEIPPDVTVYLASVDFEANDGRGNIDGTRDVAKAMRFASAADLLTFWRTQSKTRPLRPDGMPNRPLTAFSVETIPLPDTLNGDPSNERQDRN